MNLSQSSSLSVKISNFYELIFAKSVNFFSFRVKRTLNNKRKRLKNAKTKRKTITNNIVLYCTTNNIIL